MDTLQINKANALKAFQEANDKGKTLLNNLFGKEVFSQKITDRVKSYEDACKIKGIKPLKLSDFSMIPKEDQESVFAFHQLVIIVDVLNEGWVPDWNNSNEYKWYPYFNMNPSGVGFSGANYDNWNAHSTVGSRLCFKSKELAEYAAKQFESIYKNLFTK